MVDTSKLPVTKRFKLFWKHREELIKFYKDFPFEIARTPFWDIKGKAFNDAYRLASTVFDSEDLAAFRPSPNNLFVKEEKDKGRRETIIKQLTLTNLLNYAECYLQYQLYADQINNVILLYAKEDALGRLDLGRAEKEIQKISVRNGLTKLYSSDGYGGFGGFQDCTLDVIYGTLAHKYTALSTKKLHNGVEFENSCREKLIALGFETRVTKQTGDFGGDIVAVKADITYVIQCKSSSGKVGVKAIQEAVAAKKYYQADAAVVITNAEYTSAANELAVENKVILINDRQIEILEKLFV